MIKIDIFINKKYMQNNTMNMLKSRPSILISPEEAQRLLAAYEPPTESGDNEGSGARKPKSKRRKARASTLSLADVLELHGIECVDADGNVFEQYDTVYVPKDIFRGADGKQLNFTSYAAAVHCEQNGLFLPSFALSCNIVAALYAARSNPDIERVLQQYKDKGNGTGWHGQNTVIDYGAEQVIHYPTAADFGKNYAVNGSLSHTALGFAKSKLQDSLLETALHDADHARFACQLTGLRDPSVLVEVGTYFGQPAKLWFPWSGKKGVNYSDKRAAWLGGLYNLFSINSDNYLGSNDAARGVRRR